MPNDSLNFIQKLQEYGLINYLCLFGLSMWAATVKYIESLKGEKFSILDWFSEIIVCSFVGMLAAMGCKYFELDFYSTAVIVSLAAHKGTRSIYMIKSIAHREITKFSSKK